jgi:hypothetical protein
VDAPQIAGLNWHWITIAATVPGVLGLIAASLFWRRSEAIFGNIIATGIIFACSFGLIWREHVELDAIIKTCLDAETVCWPEPAAFTRYAIYAFIGLFQVCLVFTLSIPVEERIRRRDYAPEWR